MGILAVFSEVSMIYIPGIQDYVNLQIALFRKVGTYSIVCTFNEWGVEALPNSFRIADLIPFTPTKSDVDHWLNGC